jgi:hypothetical protein
LQFSLSFVFQLQQNRDADSIFQALMGSWDFCNKDDHALFTTQHMKRAVIHELANLCLRVSIDHVNHKGAGADAPKSIRVQVVLLSFSLKFSIQE